MYRDVPFNAKTTSKTSYVPLKTSSVDTKQAFERKQNAFTSQIQFSQKNQQYANNADFYKSSYQISSSGKGRLNPKVAGKKKESIKLSAHHSIFDDRDSLKEAAELRKATNYPKHKPQARAQPQITVKMPSVTGGSVKYRQLNPDEIFQGQWSLKQQAKNSQVKSNQAGDNKIYHHFHRNKRVPITSDVRSAGKANHKRSWVVEPYDIISGRERIVSDKRLDLRQSHVNIGRKQQVERSYDIITGQAW